MKFGLEDTVLSKIAGVLTVYRQIDEALLYGSRVKGNFYPGSDIDIALRGSNIDLSMLSKIALDLDELLLPWKIDLSVIGRVENPALLEQINSLGVTIYRKA